MTEHPVRAAIAAERERISQAKVATNERAAALEEELAELNAEIASLGREFDALDAADEAIISGIGDDGSNSQSGRPEQSSPTPRSAAPSPTQPAKKAPTPKVFGEDGDGPAGGVHGPPMGRLAMQAKRNEAVLQVLRETQGVLSSTEVGKAADLTESQANTALKHLENEGKATRSGKGRWTRWRLAAVTRTPVTEGPGERERGSDDVERNGSLEGRVLQACMLQPRTLEELSHADKFEGVDYSAISKVVGKLVKEGELRTRRHAGKVVYAFVG